MFSLSDDKEIFSLVGAEEKRQMLGLELIPSENYVSRAVLQALGTVFTNKYSEGYPGRRYYGGQENTDALEKIARERAKKLFRAEHANVQPLSGSPANQAVYFALLEPGDTVLALDLSHGGHLTHGHPVSAMGKVFHFVRYKTESDGRIDLEKVRTLAQEHKPKLILVGASSYPKNFDYRGFVEIAKEVGAKTMADVAHTAGFIAADVLPNPLDMGFDVMTLTTHKSLRGPRGAMILSKSSVAEAIDKAVFPGLQGGPHMNTIAAIAVALAEASTPEFKMYAKQALQNAQVLAKALVQEGMSLVAGGTENHLMVVDVVKSAGIDGAEGQKLLDLARITVNKQIIPDDPKPPLRPSGIRLGTPALTTRGMKEEEMRKIGGFVSQILREKGYTAIREVQGKVEELARNFPIPGIQN